MTCPKAGCWIQDKILSATSTLFYNRERGLLKTPDALEALE